MTQHERVDPSLESEKLSVEIKELRQKIKFFWLTPAAVGIPVLIGLLTIWQGLKTQATEHAFDREQAGIAFLEARLNKLYVPVTMHLAVTQGFFDRYPSASPAEGLLLESAWREHNRAIRQLVTEASAYITPTGAQTTQCVDSMITHLLTHLAQWDVVYRLKHEARAYRGPVYVGIKEFGYLGFPRGPCGADSVFFGGLRELRARLHAARGPG
jgi:hypothetical protein